jgi:hypothetical protein
MVRAILRESDPKTVTRRTSGLDKINEAPDYWEFLFINAIGKFVFQNRSAMDNSVREIRNPYGLPGDRLWVRETWAAFDKTAINDRDVNFIYYRADDTRKLETDGNWKPSIHMPRWASRILLEVVSVRPERLHAITEEDAKSEGVEILTMTQADIDNIQISDESPESKLFWKAMGPGQSSYRWEFEILWGQINGPGSWSKNPWVWRVEFRRVAA